MNQIDQSRFPPSGVTLKNGHQALIRLLQESDENALGDFFESVPHEDYRFYRGRPLTRELAHKTAGEASDPQRVVLILIAPTGEIGGFNWYAWKQGSTTSVFGICVRRGFQNIGAGAALMERLIEISRVIGPPEMCLTVQLANARAVRLYQQMGFRVVREQMRKASNLFPAEPEYFMSMKTNANV